MAHDHDKKIKTGAFRSRPQSGGDGRGGAFSSSPIVNDFNVRIFILFFQTFQIKNSIYSHAKKDSLIVLFGRSSNVLLNN